MCTFSLRPAHRQPLSVCDRLHPCTLYFGTSFCASDWRVAVSDSVMAYPGKSVKKAPRTENVAVCIVCRNRAGKRQFLMVRRPNKGLQNRDTLLCCREWSKFVCRSYSYFPVRFCRAEYSCWRMVRFVREPRLPPRTSVSRRASVVTHRFIPYSKSGLLAGLWEFPNTVVEGDATGVPPYPTRRKAMETHMLKYVPKRAHAGGAVCAALACDVLYSPHEVPHARLTTHKYNGLRRHAGTSTYSCPATPSPGASWGKLSTCSRTSTTPTSWSLRP